ncbi:MAG: gliding motility-associated C-terminal domain-containing protein [Lewinellaceae bacterium]|nr:gliding motility-associated C-terminal domain-containing protein [Lewinellaceae bacterium]
MKANFTLLLLLFSSLLSMVLAQGNNDCTIQLGPDVTVCNNAMFTLNPDANPDVQYTWTGPAGLSCYNCPSPNVVALPTGTYTFIANSQGAQCSDSDTITITVIDGQQPQYTLTDDKTICAGASVNLGGFAFPNTFYQWTSAPPGFLSSSPSPTVTPALTTRYFIIAFNNSCPFVSIDSVLITVVQQPVLDIQGDTAICVGESVLLGSTILEDGVHYSWTPNGGTLDNDTLPNPLATPLQTTLYQLVATNAACTEMRTVEVSVVNLTLDLDVGDTVRICQGGSAPINATLTPGATISWNPLTDLQITNNGLNVVASPDTGTLYTATTVAPGCTIIREVYVTVDSLPADLSIAPMDTTVCKGVDVLLSSPLFEPVNFPGIGFKWLPSQGQLTPDTLYNMVVQPDKTTTYTRVTSYGGCVDSSKAIVRIVEPPQISIVPSDTMICAGKSVKLKVIYPFTVNDIKWSPAEGLDCTECDEPNASPLVTTTYTATGEYQGCPTSASATVAIRPLPLIQFPTDVKLCLGESITLNQAADPTATYNWTSTDPNFTPTTAAQPVATPTQNATYFVQADNGCQNQGQVSVTVASATLTLSNDTTICQNFTATLTASGSLPGTYQWSSGQSGQNIQVTPAQTTTYTVTYTYGDNCTLTDQVTVNIDGVGPQIIFPNDKELCPGESIVLNSGNTPGAVYSWTSNPPGFSSTSAAPTDTPDQTTNYTVTATLGNCTITKSVNVIVYNATLTLPDDITICTGDVAKITANGTLSGSYLWSTGDTTAILEVSPTDDTVYDLVYSYGDGCTLEDAIKVSVKEGFSLKIVTDPDTNRINLGDPFDLQGIVAPSQNLSGFQFQWLQNGQTPLGTTDEISIIPTSQEDTTFNVTYVLIATAPSGCREQAQFTLTVVYPLKAMPNAFTPNGDGVNDLFRLNLVEGTATVLSMEIYNRWGKKVYESTDPAATWDGTSEGKDAPSDVYVYVIRWQRDDGALQPPLIGDITLLR